MGLLAVDVIEQVHIGGDRLGAFVPRRECLNNVLKCVAEVEHKRVALVWMDPVESGQCLYGIETGERFVDIHRVKEWLVESGLKLFGNDENLVLTRTESFLGFAVRKTIHVRFSKRAAFVYDGAGERD